METKASKFEFNSSLIDFDNVPEISEDTQKLSVCNFFFQKNSIQPDSLPSLKKSVTTLKEITNKLTHVQNNKGMHTLSCALRSLLSLVCTAALVAAIVLLVIFGATMPPIAVSGLGALMAFLLGGSVNLSVYNAFEAFISENTATLVGVLSTFLQPLNALVPLYECFNKIPNLKKQVEKELNNFAKVLETYEAILPLKAQIEEEIKKLENSASVSLQDYKRALEEFQQLEKFIKTAKNTISISSPILPL